MSYDHGLELLIDMLRSKGVVEFERDGLRIVLGTPPSAVEAESVKPVDNPAPSRKAGKDGLFAEEQLAIYGHVKDAEG